MIYHQPPVYFLKSFTLEDPFGSRIEAGGRFRLDHPSLKNRRGNPELFERETFIDRVENDSVVFNYSGWHQELIDGRITRADVIWASDLLGRLRIDQWGDAFRAGGYDAATADRFIRRLLAKIREGQELRGLGTGD